MSINAVTGKSSERNSFLQSAGARAELAAWQARAGDGDVFASGLLRHGDSLGQGTSLAHLGQFDQHRKIDPCEHVHLRTAHTGNREVGRRAAEHVSQDRNTVATLDAAYRVNDIASTQIGVVLGSDCDGFNLSLLTHDMFERRPKFVGKAPMGHKY